LRNKYFIPFGIPFDEYIDYDDFNNMPVEEKQGALYEGIVLEDDVHKDGIKMSKIERSSLASSRGTILARSQTMRQQAMKMEYFNQNRIIGSINVAKPSVIFYSIPFDNGWKAKVDNVKTDLWQAHIGFTGLYVEAGKHIIELYYEPPLSKTGWFGVLGAALIGFVIYRYQREFWK